MVGRKGFFLAGGGGGYGSGVGIVGPSIYLFFLIIPPLRTKWWLDARRACSNPSEVTKYQVHFTHAKISHMEFLS